MLELVLGVAIATISNARPTRWCVLFSSLCNIDKLRNSSALFHTYELICTVLEYFYTVLFVVISCAHTFRDPCSRLILEFSNVVLLLRQSQLFVGTSMCACACAWAIKISPLSKSNLLGHQYRNFFPFYIGTRYEQKICQKCQPVISQMLQGNLFLFPQVQLLLFHFADRLFPLLLVDGVHGHFLSSRCHRL